MKKIIITLLILSISTYSICQDFEIFYWTVEYRDSINQDFVYSELEEVVAMISFQDSIVSVRGTFSNWDPKYWFVLGKSFSVDRGDFIQIIAPLVDPASKEAVILSFIQGPFEFKEEIVMPNGRQKFECTMLYEKKRYVFLGIIE